MTDYNIEKLFNDLLEKQNADKQISYTSTLLDDKDLLARKLGEESIELIIEYLSKNKNNIVKESADLLYHLSVIWISSSVNPKDVWNELSKRKSKSGLDEKKSRKN